MQHTGAGIGGALGGGEDVTFAHTRRGPEKFIFNATIVLAIAYILSMLVALAF